MEMLFEDRLGQPIALLPHRQDGSHRVADGIKVFALDQAAGHFQAWSQQSLRELWEATFQDVAALVAQDQAARETAGEASPRAAVLDGPAGLDLMRSVLYPFLEEDEFRVFLQVCRERDVNPWLKRVIPKVERDEQGKRRIVYVTTVEQLRITAERTGKYAGQTRPRWSAADSEDWVQKWTSQEPPAAAEVGVHKGTVGETFWGVVMFEELAQRNEKGELEESWQKMPALMLAKCAEAAALRKAFPDECGGFYLREELRPRRSPATAGQAASSSPAAAYANGGQSAPAEDEDDSLPKTERQFRLAMIELVGNRRVDAVVEGFRREFGLRMQPLAFWTRVVRAVRDNPQLYGMEDAA